MFNFDLTFQNKKLLLPTFQEKFSDFIENDIKRRKSFTKKKGIKTACDEISVLLDLALHYKASHLKWTGDHKQRNYFDGVLYFNNIEKKVEISRVLDEKMNQELKKTGCSERNFKIKDIDFNIKSQSIGLLDTRSFIYHRVLGILEKKNQKKYKGFWLAIAYEPAIIKINESYVSRPIFTKIQQTQQDLLFSIRDIFKKIVFVPNGMQFKTIQSNKSVKYNVFEWKI